MLGRKATKGEEYKGFRRKLSNEEEGKLNRSSGKEAIEKGGLPDGGSVQLIWCTSIKYVLF